MNLSKCKLIVLFLFFIKIFIFPFPAFAQSNSFVSIVNPIRGEDFWQEKNQTPATAVEGEIKILQKFNLPATWLLRFDTLDDQKIIDLLKVPSRNEIGLFLEITPSLTKEAGVTYHDKKNWHDAESAFLTGYERGEREKLITANFDKFKEIFGFYPKSVGAWWVDSYSLGFMQKKYGITTSLIVADQYTTDNYQIWGQYFGTPYYPSKTNALHPAQSIEDKIPLVMVQWAARDPVNGYGDGVEQSTFSVQANDYLDYHKLDSKYFSTLVDIYTKQPLNQFGYLVAGLENSYSWEKYGKEYENQISTLANKLKSGQLSVVTMQAFSSWYKSSFPALSPEHLIVADDSLGTFKKVVWFMNPYYRAGWFVNQDGAVFRDIRQYIGGEEEPCFLKRCSELNFATFATRVLDDVTYGHKWVIDQGKVRDFAINKAAEKYIISYTNEAGNARKIEFLPKDISVDGKISSIDQAILNATRQETSRKTDSNIGKGSFKWSAIGVLSKTVKFILFAIFGCLIPGLVIFKSSFEKMPIILRIFLSTLSGFVILTLIFYLVSLLSIRPFIWLFLFVNLLLFIKLKLYQIKIEMPKNLFNLVSVGTVLAGTLFLSLPSFRNGLTYPYGLGFWGPNTHDGIWHLSLINQLIKAVPPENPVFASTILKNYHFFYDLLIAATSYLSTIPPIDLVFRFYPIIFALMLGIGSYYLLLNLFKNKFTVILGLYFVYFAGSFGWIVSYIKDKNLAGESAFWANQTISFNLNPPFAISLLIIIALFHILFTFEKRKKANILLAIILTGSILGFKAYGGVLVLGSLLILAILRRQALYLLVFLCGSIISGLIFFANFQATSQLLIFSPFWLIHSMIDSPDRVGWARLSLARQAGFEKSNWFKFILVEVFSLILFIIGNLGMRVFAFIPVVNSNKIFRDDRLLLMLILSILSFLIPILFIQSGNPWNTIQFSYYGLYIGAIAAAASLSNLFFKLPKFLSLVLLLAVLILTPINSIVTATYYTGYLPHARVDAKELEALEFLSKQDMGVVLTYPYDKKIKQKIAEPWPLFAYDSTAYVSAISRKPVFIEDEPQNQILLTDYQKRLVALKDFFSIPANGKTFLKENNIKFIYLPKIYNVSLDSNLLGIDVIFENEETIVFKVK